jgi:hypothetical protein
VIFDPLEDGMSTRKIIAPLCCVLLFAARAAAQLAPPYVEYAAKFTCGQESTKESNDVVSGAYASSINIYNPQSTVTVNFTKKIVVANREDTTIGRIITLTDVLKPDQADRVDCPFIKKTLNQAAATYVEGFVVIEVPRAASPTGSAAKIQPVLDVIGKYTARPLTGDVSAEAVVQVAGKSIAY